MKTKEKRYDHNINNFLNMIEDVVKEAHKLRLGRDKFLYYCNKYLPISYPDTFMKAYYEKKRKTNG